MHLEILTEEISARKALDNLLPKLVIDENTYKIITYQGKADLLKKLPGVLKGYSHFLPDDWKIIILIDLDKDDCRKLKSRLNSFVIDANLKLKNTSNLQNSFQVINRIAIEELESWFLGDPEAIKIAYPRVGKFSNKPKYRIPDQITNPSEVLERILQSAGYYPTGMRKIEIAEKVSSNMVPLSNRSKSFSVFWRAVIDCLKQ